MSTKPVVILGGGLWGGLLAYRLHQTRADLDFLLVEKDLSFGGQHTWSFHESDVTPETMKWLQPFITKSWPGYRVKFPQYERSFEGAYHSISSDQFHSVLSTCLPWRNYQLGRSLELQEAGKEGSFVIDARGQFDLDQSRSGYQKFFGLLLELEKPHQISLPCLMDATVSQIDGYRFIYYLPYSENRILIEDTRYSDDPHFKRSDYESQIALEIEKKGWVVKRVIKTERGVLPLPYYKVEPDRNIQNASLAGIFHDVTGYSFPDAIRAIEQLVHLPKFDSHHVRSTLGEYRKQRLTNRSYFQLLNKMLFKAAEPQKRYVVLEHFYKLPQPLIERFYRGDISSLDKVRILMGKPPVPISRAIQSIWSKNTR